MAGCNIRSFNAFEDYVADANECLKFKLITSPEDLEEDFEAENRSEGKSKPTDKELANGKPGSRIAAFKPEMTYAFFGENENIFGYKNLCVKVYYSCSKLNIYLGMTYSDMVTKDKTGGVSADEVLKIISNKYETKVSNNLSEFSANLCKEKSFVPYGEILEEFSIDYQLEGEQTRKRHFQINRADNSVPGFVAYHERMQTFLMWFIEAASYIDMDDDRWDIFTLYEKMPTDRAYTGDSVPLEFEYCFVGFCTAYRYYSFPTNLRPRISQFVVLPPFQRIGLGTRMLKALYSHYNTSTVTDIRVEDPSDNFQLLRDILDCTLCESLSSFSPDKLNKGWSIEMAKQAQEVHKISARQSRRVYEILRLKATDRLNEEQYKLYRMMIKQRLNAPFQKQIRDLDRVKTKIPETQYASLMKALNNIPLEGRIHMLANQYEEVEADYLSVIEKLA